MILARYMYYGQFSLKELRFFLQCNLTQCKILPVKLKVFWFLLCQVHIYRLHIYSFNISPTGIIPIRNAWFQYSIQLWNKVVHGFEVISDNSYYGFENVTMLHKNVYFLLYICSLIDTQFLSKRDKNGSMPQDTGKWCDFCFVTFYLFYRSERK